MDTFDSRSPHAGQRMFRLWVRETIHAVLDRAETVGDRLPSCDAVWDASSWNTVERAADGEGGGKRNRVGEKKRRRSRVRRSKLDEL